MKLLVAYKYFKESGKYYSDAAVLVDKPGDINEALPSTVKEAKQSLSGQEWPGLTPGNHVHEFHTVVTIYDEPEDTRHNNAVYMFMVPVCHDGEGK